MYEIRQKKTDVIYAVSAWILEMAALYGVGYAATHHIPQPVGYITIVYVLCVVFVLLKERSFKVLGFGTEKIKRNAPIALAIVLISFVIRVIMDDKSVVELIPKAINMLIFTAFREEILFRGIMQNYLMVSSKKKVISYIVGGLFFATSHIPLYSLNQPGIPLWLQLTFAFAGHFIFVAIARWRKDLTIPAALHFFMDFVLSA